MSLVSSDMHAWGISSTSNKRCHWMIDKKTKQFEFEGLKIKQLNNFYQISKYA